MAKCRLCLNNRKKMLSLYVCMDEALNVSYADIVSSISNIKLSKSDGVPTDICMACCKRLKDVHQFRCQVERCNIELLKTCQIKRLIFNDIQDIKHEIIIAENCSKDIIPDKTTEEFVRSCNKTINYNNTVIKRLKNQETNDKKSLSVKEFLDSIKEDPDNEFDIIYDVAVDYDPESDVGDDEDYTPIKKYSYNNKKKVNKGEISLKPVLLSDIRMVRTKVKFKKRNNLKTCKPPPRVDVCPHCGRMVTSLKTHALIHIGERNFKCEKCSKTFFSKQSLNSHQKCHANKVYKCDKCVAIFHRVESLKMHQLVHKGIERSFPCEICGKKFRTNGHLWRHCQGVHNMGVKKYNCDQCSMSFVTKAHLIHHTRVHTGERPFKCEICSQPYSYKHDFNRHCFKRHGVFLKGRQVNVMNEEVLVKEKAVMTELMLRINGVLKDDKPINPFEGPHAVKAFEEAVKALETRQIQIDA